jgi:predicted nucleic acid-binding protein
VILVVDASVAIKWFLHFKPDEAHAVRALRILEGAVNGTHELVAPTHFFAEVAAVLSREKPHQAAADLRDLLDIDIRRAESQQIYMRGIELALRLGQHAFDTLYHAVALETPGATLVTADQRYYDRARGERRITLLADLDL